MDYRQQMEQDRLEVEQALRQYLLAHRDSLQQIVLDAMAYSVEAGGKRVRPVLTLEVCRMLGGQPENALACACAVEMIHSSSLIHDDLPCMDDDDLRRGRPSCHVQFGQANALLAGDALLLRAFEVIAENSALAPAVALEAVRILAHASGIDGMVGGQTIDLAYENQQASAEVLHTMHLLKTGALIQASCQMGAVAASASTVEFQAITEYAKSLGLAFQICDDILNVTGNQEQMGKPVGNDQQQQKTNFISVYGLERSQQLAREWTDQAKHALEPFAQNGFLLWMTDQLLHRQN